MMKKFLIIGLSALALGACATKEYHYWQKVDPNTAIYLTGVKAQQTLEQDLSECVHTIIELTQLGNVRGQLGDTLNGIDQRQLTEDMSRLPRWDVPEYILDLRVDHTEFQDFDGCMRYKGWKRVRYVGPEAEFRSKEIYDDTGSYSVRPFNTSPKANVQMDQLHQER